MESAPAALEKNIAEAKHKKQIAAFLKPANDIIMHFRYNSSLPSYGS